MGMRRRVVFSTDQLIVSFGGAIGLFLGASFISVYGLIYVCSEFVISNLFAIFKRKTVARRDRIQMVRMREHY